MENALLLRWLFLVCSHNPPGCSAVQCSYCNQPVAQKFTACRLYSAVKGDRVPILGSGRRASGSCVYPSLVG
jgi:hypothetical protein